MLALEATAAPAPSRHNVNTVAILEAIAEHEFQMRCNRAVDQACALHAEARPVGETWRPSKYALNLTAMVSMTTAA